MFYREMQIPLQPLTEEQMKQRSNYAILRYGHTRMTMGQTAHTLQQLLCSGQTDGHTDGQTDSTLTCSFSLLASMGMTLRIGSSSISTLGGDFLRHMLGWSQQPPSRNIPLT